jgi:hypothetical protein
LKASSASFVHQYYYLIYGNGKDTAPDGKSLKGWNWLVSPKDY